MTLLEELFDELESGAVRIAPEFKAKYLLRESQYLDQNTSFDPDAIVSPRTILVLISDVLQIPMAEIRSANRKRNLVMARHITCYFARKYTSASLHEIGANLNRDHTTVIHSVKTVENIKEYGLDSEKNLIKKIEHSILERLPVSG